MYNRVIMMGRIANDPELRTTPSGTNLCTFRIAVERRYQAQGEERKADFFNVAAWRGTGDFVHQYFSKGKTILVEGEMQTRAYTDKNGNQATWYEIIADRVSFTGEKATNTAAPATPVPPAPTAPAPNAAPSQTQSPVQQQMSSYSSPAYTSSDDDYPF